MYCNKCENKPFRYLVINSIDRNNTTDTPANFQINLPYGITYNCCELIQFNIANSFYNITTNNNTLILNGTSFSVPPGCYNSDELFTAIGNFEYIESITYNSISAQTVINIVTGPAGPGNITLTFPSTGSIHAILGFPHSYNQTGTVFNSINALSLANFNIYMETDLLSSNVMTSNSYKHPCWVLPNNGNKGDILTFNEMSQYKLFLTSNNANNIIYNLSIYLKDQYGSILQGCSEFTMVLRFF